MIKYVKIDDVDDDFNDVRKEYSNIRVKNLIGGKNGRSVKNILHFQLRLRTCVKQEQNSAQYQLKLYDFSEI